jgi:hypothetical protein
MMKDGVVIQQSVIQNLTKEPRRSLEFGHKFDLRVLIRDLDFVDPSYGFNEEYDNYTKGAEPNGYGFVKVHRLPKTNEPDVEHEPKTFALSHACADNSVARIRARGTACACSDDGLLEIERQYAL